MIIGQIAEDFTEFLTGTDAYNDGNDLMTRHTRVRTLILIALVMSLLLLLPHSSHAPGLVLGLMWLPILLFVPIDFRRTLPPAGYTVDYTVNESLAHPRLFQRPPPLL